MKRKILLVLFIAVMGMGNIYPQASRGPTPGEIYIKGRYAVHPNDPFNMLIHTNNYGRNFTQKYLYQDGSDNTPIGQVLADATPSVLYSAVTSTWTNDPESWGLYRSVDDGESWEFVSALFSQNESFATGNIKNEIFRKSQGVIYKSEDNGDNWTQMQINIPGSIQTGNQQGEVYVMMGNVSFGNITELYVSHSLNDGVDFESYGVDSLIYGQIVSGHGPVISSGTTPGELYLTTWWLPANYKIYRSIDHGQSFTLQYEQPDTCYFWDEGYHFTAGRAEGEFYIVKRKIIVTEDWDMNTRFHIFHSNDHAQSFSEYIHILDDNFDGVPIQIIHTISARVNPDGGGTVEGDGKYDEGEQVNLMATPAPSYEFINWTENDQIISHDSTLSFTADSTRTLMANFQLINNITNHELAGISLYPNPTKGNITLSFQQVQGYNDVLFEVLSIDGRKLLSKPIHSELSTHDISNLPAGMYIYRFADGGLIIKTGKLIIN